MFSASQVPVSLAADGVPLLFCPFSSLREPERGEMNENGRIIHTANNFFLVHVSVHFYVC